MEAFPPVHLVLHENLAGGQLHVDVKKQNQMRLVIDPGMQLCNLMVILLLMVLSGHCRNSHYNFNPARTLMRSSGRSECSYSRKPTFSPTVRLSNSAPL